MRHARSRIAPSTLIATLALAVGCAGCAGKQSRADSAEKTVQGSPPREESDAEMPEGPEVKVDSDYPEERERDRRQRRADRAANGPLPRRDGGTYIHEGDVRELMEHGPGYVFQVVEVEPVERDGSFAGYRIVALEPGVRKVLTPQLKVGDLVTEVNGVTIEKPDDYIAAWEKLDYRAVLVVEYVRDGESGHAVWVVRERAARQRQEDRRGRRR